MNGMGRGAGSAARSRRFGCDYDLRGGPIGGPFITANARRLLAGDKVCSGPLGTARDGSGRFGTARDGSGPLGMLGIKRVKPKLLMKIHM